MKPPEVRILFINNKNSNYKYSIFPGNQILKVVSYIKILEALSEND